MHMIRPLFASVATAFLIFTFASATHAATIYVLPGGAGAQNGMSWSNAYGELQTALTNAPAGSEIWVAAGTYRPDLGTNDRDVSFELRNGVAIYGGFDGTETSREQRDFSANETILSGDIGVPGDNSDNSFHVVFAASIDNSGVLDGFTIQDGNASSDPSSFWAGGGVRFEASSATLRNLMIRDCVASYGGGLVAFIPPPTETLVTNVTFRNNVALGESGGGGGAFVAGNAGTVTFAQCRFENNSAGQFGGGVSFYTDGGFVDCAFDGNDAAGNGGGVSFQSTSSAFLMRVTFQNNSSYYGGAITLQNSTCTADDCLFQRNTAGFVGGAIFSFESTLAIRNSRHSGNAAAVSAGAISLFHSASQFDGCAFIGNTSESSGAVSVRGNQLNVTNSTFTRNYAATTAGGILFLEGAMGAITNSILWNNQDTNGTLSTSQVAWAVGNPVPTIQYCDFNGATGPTWMAVDPVFARNPFAGADGVWGTADDDYGDVRLACTSPLVDAGSNALVAAGLTTDLGGRPRFVDNPGVGDTGSGTAPIVDLGAYESHPEIDCGACFPAGGGCVAAFADHCGNPGDVFMGYDVSCGDPAFVVDRLAMPGGTGSAAAPFQTFAEAVAASPTSVSTTLYVKTAGHYAESVTFNKPTRFVNPTGQTIRIGN